MSDVQKLLDALQEKSGFEVIEKTATEDQVRLMGRVPEDATKQNIHNWLLVTRSLLLSEKSGAPWNVDVSKQYFLKGVAGQEQVVYAHRLIIQCKNIAEHLSAIAETVLGAKQAVSGELESFPLPGANRSRNESPDGIKRGARSVRS